MEDCHEARRYATGRGWCSMHQERWRRLGTLELNRPTPMERFEAKIDRSGGPSACHPWLGAQDIHGYGRFNPGGDQRGNLLAARWLIEQRLGLVLPRELVICHQCDNPPCMNPAHLFVGTQADNLRDASQKGRLVSSLRRLDDAQVEALRSRYATTDASIQSLADEFDIAYVTAHRIISGERYVHSASAT